MKAAGGADGAPALLCVCEFHILLVRVRVSARSGGKVNPFFDLI